ncbi:OmpA family protein [Porticoccaceae bacterium]|nr:OmpA family protein [Porticoccaceae bacterium]MDA8682283.1 OmpA family protein [Porticoccaceae bacterium]
MNLVDEQNGLNDEGKCPKCPNLAPPWMATFADMAILLMAFFALLYSFTELNLRDRANFAASIRSAFGVERPTILNDIQSATSVVEDEFSPVIAKRDASGSPLMEAPLPVRFYRTEYTKNYDGTVDVEKAYVHLKETLAEELIRGDVKLKIEDEKLVVEVRSLFTSGGNGDDKVETKGARVRQSVIDISAKILSVKSTSSVPIDLWAQDLETPRASDKENRKQLEHHFKEMRDVLSDDIGNGLLNVVIENDLLVITLDAQNTFASGQAALNDKATLSINKVGKLLTAYNGKIRVEGHTDSMPIMFGDNFTTNWDLSTARASSVAAAFIGNSNISKDRLIVAGFADSKPKSANTTKEGRAKNRRVEIIVNASAATMPLAISDKPDNRKASNG